MKSRTLTCITAITLFAVLAIPVQLAAQAHTRYQLIDIGTLGGPVSYDSVDGIADRFLMLNDAGIVASSADTPFSDPDTPNCFHPDCFLNHAFRWQKGVIADLGSLPGVHNSGASWISQNGFIVGGSETDLIDPLGGPELRGVLWTKHGQIINLGTVGGNESFALSVNSRGQVTGWSTNAISDPFSILQLGFQTRAFLWQHGVMRDLSTLGGPDALASYVNEHGQVAGFSYTDSTPNIGVQCPGAVTSDLGNCGGPAVLNNRGQVIGSSTLPGDLISRPFLWDHGVITDLGTLGGDNGEALAINDAGEKLWARPICLATRHSMRSSGVTGQ